MHLPSDSDEVCHQDGTDELRPAALSDDAVTDSAPEDCCLMQVMILIH